MVGWIFHSVNQVLLTFIEKLLLKYLVVLQGDSKVGDILSPANRASKISYKQQQKNNF